MTAATTGTASASEVAARVRAGLDETVGHIHHRILTEIPFYAEGGAGDTGEFRARLHVNVEAAIDAMLGAPHNPGPPAETGRMRARQQAPLADVLTAYRIGYTEIFETIVRAGRTSPAVDPDLVIELGRRIFEAHNKDADALMHAFREEAQHLLLQHERQRAALIDVLLAEGTDLGTLVEVARSLKLPMHGNFVVVVASTELGQDPLPRVAAVLAAQDVASVWRQRYDVAVGVLSLHEASRYPVAEQILERHATGPVAVSPLFSSLRRTAWALDLAELVLTRHPGGAVVEQFQDTPLRMLVAGGRDAARDTARHVLGDLLTLPEDAQDTLLVTLHTWVEAAGSANRTGELLHCHPNTIRKRLRKLEECTGRSLSEPGGVAEVVAACQAWSQLSPAVVPDRRPAAEAARS